MLVVHPALLRDSTPLLLPAWTERWDGTIRSGDAEDERTLQNMTIIGRLRSINHDIHRRR
jgi:hypothetical protein